MLSRRRMVAGLAAATALAPVRALALNQCESYSETVRQCQVGLDVTIDIARQRCNAWCWAACIEAIFTMHNRPVAQEVVVEKIWGSDYDTNCKPAFQEDIVDAVNGRWEDAKGRQFQARAEILPMAWMGVRTRDGSGIDADPTDPAALASVLTQDLFVGDDLRVMVDELAKGNPLIILSTDGEMAHAVVLIAVEFLQNSFGTIALTQLVVRDPWPDSPNLRTYSADEINGTFSVIKVTVV